MSLVGSSARPDEPAVWVADIGSTVALTGWQPTHDLRAGVEKMWAWFQGEAAFEQRAACLVNQYGNFTAVGDLKVNGRLTLGENIADLGGVHLAYAGLEKALNGTVPPPIDGLSAPQRFFVAYAQAWCGNTTDQEKRRRDNGEFHGRGAVLVLAYGSEELSHGQPNLIMAVRVMGAGKVPATLRPGNNDVKVNVVCTWI